MGRQLNRMYKELEFENVTLIPVGFTSSDLALITEAWELQENLNALEERGDITSEEAQSAGSMILKSGMSVGCSAPRCLPSWSLVLNRKEPESDRSSRTAPNPSALVFQDASMLE